jgi:GMP synthase PP-ATPase subunit
MPPERLDVVRAADAILLEELRTAGVYDAIGQAGGSPMRRVKAIGPVRVRVRAKATSDARSRRAAAPADSARGARKTGGSLETDVASV